VRTFIEKLKSRRRSLGQALVEMALVMPILCVLLFAIIDMGYAIFVYSTLYSSTREGIRLAAINDPYALACLMFAFMMILAGRIQDKFGARVTAFAGGVLVGLGFLMISQSTAYWAWLAGFGGLVGTGQAARQSTGVNFDGVASRLQTGKAVGADQRSVRAIRSHGSSQSVRRSAGREGHGGSHRSTGRPAPPLPVAAT